jgi:MFS family permease
MLYSGMNGIGLALVVPCVQSLIADYTPADKRGAAFGVLYFTGALGEHRPASQLQRRIPMRRTPAS